MKITLEIPAEWENKIDDYFETAIEETEESLAYHPFRGHSRIDFLTMLRESFRQGEKQ